MPDFAFVNVTRPGDEKRQSTKIRRHVMRDIGKARRKTRKSRETTVVADQAVGASDPRDGDEDEDGPSPAFRQAAGYCNPMADGGLSTLVYPTEMDEERLSLVRFMFDEAKSKYGPFRFPWLSMGLSDPAAWHITLANAVLSRNMQPRSRKPEYNSNDEAMKWYTLSLRSITKRLADPKSHDSEGLVIAVAGFICHDTTTGNFERQEIHMKGLKRLVDNRGGLEQLRNPALRLVISWHDLCGATYRNSTPYFSIPRGSITEINTGDDTRYLEQLLEKWCSKCPAIGDLTSAMKATAAVASYVNRHGGDAKFWRDDLVAARLVGPALHEVLMLEGRPLPDDAADPSYSSTAAREAFRRAALVFLAAVKVRFGAPALDMERHLDAFRQITQLPMVDWACVPELNLWAHVIVALQEESCGRAWHVFTIVEVMGAMGLSSAKQAFDVARGIIWVECDDPAQCEALMREVDGLVRANMIREMQLVSLDPGLEIPSGEQTAASLAEALQ